MLQSCMGKVMAIHFEEGSECSHTWLKLGLVSNTAEISPFFFGVCFHRVVVSMWFPLVDDVLGLELEGRGGKISDAHG